MTKPALANARRKLGRTASLQLDTKARRSARTQLASSPDLPFAGKFAKTRALRARATAQAHRKFARPTSKPIDRRSRTPHAVARATAHVALYHATGT